MIKRFAETETCPCFFTTPCHEDCSCVHPLMSRGCDRCCRHGSMEQRKAKAEGLARMYEQLALAKMAVGEAVFADVRDHHGDVDGPAETINALEAEVSELLAERPVDKQSLSPDQAILDIVLDWDKGVRVLCKDPLRLLLVGKNHLGQTFQQFIEPQLDGDPEDGPPARFVLYQLGATVWKISPSLQVPTLVHGYLTLVNVPDPAPWQP